MEANQIINSIKTLIEPILHESGKVIYSSVDTISKGDLYILGLNPGGDVPITIIEDLERLTQRSINAYMDETWGNRRNPSYRKGKHPLQKNVTLLIQNLGYNPRQVFCSNLIFVRSRKAEESIYRSQADLCWAVHKELIKIVDPKCLIVFGNSKLSPFQYINGKYPPRIGDRINSGHGTWHCYSCTGEIEGKERVLIGLPHLSRYYVNRHNDVLRWIVSKI